MDGVPYPQPLTGHEPQYVPWGVLLVRPIGHPPRPVPPRAAGHRSRAYPTLLLALRWGRYGHRGGPQTPEVGYLTSVVRGPLSPRPPPLVPAPLLSSPGALAPCRAPWLPPCPVCPCWLSLLRHVGALGCSLCVFVFFFFFFFPPSPFLRVGVGVGGGGGGGGSRCPPFCARGGGGCRVAPVVTLPFLRLHPRRSPRGGLHGACPPWARSSRPFVTPPRRGVPGGGSAARYRHPSCPLAISPLPSPLSSVGAGGGGEGGGVRPRCPSSGVSTSQARHWHAARPLSSCWGVRHAAWPLPLPCPRCVLSPGAPPAGEGGPLPALPFPQPPPLGGRRLVGGGGPCRFPAVALAS